MPAKKPRKVSKPHTEEEIADALINNDGVGTEAAKELGITIRAIRYRLAKSENLRKIAEQAREEARERFRDEFERLLMQRVLDPKANPVLTIFAAKCMLKDRGWVDTVQRENKAPDVKIAIVNYANGTTEVSVSSDEKKEIIDASATAIPARPEKK